MKRFYLKILLPTFLTILLFILTIFLIIIPHYQQNILNGKREMIKELTNSAWSILSKYENDEKNGLLTRGEAQKNAISRIQYLRYGDESKDYFWITDMEPVMVMHPFRTDLNGKDLSNFKDPHGKKLFVECVETVKKSEHGYVNYMWQWKDDSLHIVPKLSYVKIFKPWNWVIGTGIYIEDVKKEIATLTKKLIWISIGISMLIAFLLIYIIKQSLNIERKRIEAEKELNESKEKYKTLVEAATEGLLMLVDGKISFANNVIKKMIGYEPTELVNRPLNQIISENNNKEIISIFLKNSIIKEGQFELNIKKKSGGFVEVLVTTSTAKFFGNSVNIIIIKDISIDRNQAFSNLDYQKLIGTLNLGLFKVRIDTKGKLLYANETAIKILGFENFSELADVNILKLFVTDTTDRKNIRKNLIAEGYIKHKILAINNKNKGSSIVSVSLVVIDAENPEQLVCDGIIKDITIQEIEKSQYNNIITELKTNSFLMEQPIKNYIVPFHSIESDASIANAVGILSKQKTDCLLVAKNETDYLGIITNDDIQKRVLTLKLNLDNPVYLIMSSPIIYINSDTPVIDAINICDNYNINHLVVKDISNNIIGIFNVKTIHKSIVNSLSLFIDKVNKAETNEELKQYYKAQQQFIKPLINSDIFIKHITNLTSTFSDSVLKRIIDLSIQKLGEPPVDFSFICLGSEGRKEESLYTDQDNAIIYEDVPADKETFVSDYFMKLGNMVCNSLNHVGYAYCKGNIMAKNPQWNKPISTWVKYFTNWITTPEPQNLLDAVIFFDFRNVYGNEKFTEHLRGKINALVSQQSVFLYHLACNVYNTKTQNISTANILSDKNTEIDLKSSVNHIIMFARAYSLQNNIEQTNTIERLNALKSKQIIEKNTSDEIIFVYNHLMKLRFKNQINLLDNNLPLSNVLDTKSLTDIELSILKKVLSQISTYQNKLSIDFRILT